VNIATLLPFILIIGVMLLMTRSAKNKQRQAGQMRDKLQPGTGVRTIGGLIAVVKEVRDTTVLLETAPGVHSLYAKTAVGTVLGEEEYDRLVNHDVPLSLETEAAEHPIAEHAPIEPEAIAGEGRVELGKPAAAGELQSEGAGMKAAEAAEASGDPESDEIVKGDKDADK
jgi:preprotein translocase subunit YajC